MGFPNRTKTGGLTPRFHDAPLFGVPEESMFQEQQTPTAVVVVGMWWTRAAMTSQLSYSLEVIGVPLQTLIAAAATFSARLSCLVMPTHEQLNSPT
mmetsp:Transcript_36521/g.67479  ORF Transcript_36521/g.67479 Transcript_36521/m.67479 type:complete len:96 (+) Transcript_36521:246-533(+)